MNETYPLDSTKIDYLWALKVFRYKYPSRVSIENVFSLLVGAIYNRGTENLRRHFLNLYCRSNGKWIVLEEWDWFDNAKHLQTQSGMRSSLLFADFALSLHFWHITLVVGTEIRAFVCVCVFGKCKVCVFWSIGSIYTSCVYTMQRYDSNALCVWTRSRTWSFGTIYDFRAWIRFDQKERSHRLIRLFWDMHLFMKIAWI